MENWQIPPIENRHSRQRYVEYIYKILGKDWDAEYRRGEQKASEHFAYAREIYPHDPGLYYAFALFLWRNQRVDQAIQHLEAAVAKVKEGVAPVYLAPWKLLIQLKVQRRRDAEAMRLAVEMAEQLDRYAANDSRSAMQTERTVNGYVAWLGAIVGFLEGPKAQETGSRINHAAWNERINSALNPGQRRLFQAVQGDIAMQFASELRRADDIRAQWHKEEQKKRESGERRRHQIVGDKRRVNAMRHDSWHDQHTSPPYRRSREHYLRGHYNTVKDHFTQTIYDTPGKPPLRFPYTISTYLPNSAEQEREMFVLSFPAVGRGEADLAQHKLRTGIATDVEQR